MDKEEAHTAVARAMFGAAGVLMLAVSLGMPSWAQGLRTEGYYAALHLDLFTQPAQAAGTTDRVGARVRNLGQDAAIEPWLRLSADAGASLHSADCVAEAAGAVRCDLPSIPANGEVSLDVQLLIHPDSRGILTIVGVAGDHSPGIVVDIAGTDVRGLHDIGVSVVDAVPATLDGGALRWTFVVDNLGPSSTFAWVHEVTALHVGEAEIQIECRAGPGATCPQQDEAGYLNVGAGVEVDVTVPPFGIDFQMAAIRFSIETHEGEGLDLRPTAQVVVHSQDIFADGFGG
jgi:hypothetical protein